MTSYLITFYLFFYLPTDPTLARQMSIEQDINLAWPHSGTYERTHLLCKYLVDL